ncbi:MAG TPA: hypothetical protein VKX34_06270 [Aequorivita sp.]|nr:hypothetical protein [Aequorivita sp.]
MKKIKLLNAMVIGLIVIFVMFFIGNIYLTFFSDFMNQFDHIYDDFVFGSSTKFIVLFISSLTFVGLIFIKKGLGVTLKNEVFNSKSSLSFVVAGYFFLLSGALGGVFNIISFIHSNGITGVASFGQDLLLVILSFILFIVVDIIKDGNELRLDSELTI